MLLFDRKTINSIQCYLNWNLTRAKCSASMKYLHIKIINLMCWKRRCKESKLYDFFLKKDTYINYFSYLTLRRRHHHHHHLVVELAQLRFIVFIVSGLLVKKTTRTAIKTHFDIFPLLLLFFLSPHRLLCSFVFNEKSWVFETFWKLINLCF